MTPIVTVPCPCGREIKATDPEPGERLRCYYCGHSAVFGREEGDDRPGRTGDMEPAALEELGSLLEGLRPEDLACPSCDATMAVALRDDGDKVAVCQYCGREADLPERRGVTRRRVRRKPGQTDIIEETAWTEETCRKISVPGVLDVSFGRGPAPDPEVSFSFDGDLDDPEVFAEFLQQVQKNLPPGQAKAVLAEMRRMRRRRAA